MWESPLVKKNKALDRISPVAHILSYLLPIFLFNNHVSKKASSETVSAPQTTRDTIMIESHPSLFVRVTVGHVSQTLR